MGNKKGLVDDGHIKPTPYFLFRLDEIVPETHTRGITPFVPRLLRCQERTVCITKRSRNIRGYTEG
jgi:hypothetical protein